VKDKDQMHIKDFYQSKERTRKRITISSFLGLFLVLLSLPFGFCDAKSCDCVDCNCGGGTCPISVSAGDYFTETLTCSPGEEMNIEFQVQSTDDSTFKVYGMDYSNYVAFQNGDQYYDYTDFSSSSSMTCFDSASATVNIDEFYVVFKCENLVYDCPLQYEFSHTCDSSSPPPQPPPSYTTGDAKIKTVPLVLVMLSMFILLQPY